MYFDYVFEIQFDANILERPFDVMITDYIGLWGIRDADLFGFYKCRIRVLDSFGTDPSCKECRKINAVWTSVCVYMWPPPRLLIISGMMSCVI